MKLRLENGNFKITGTIIDDNGAQIVTVGDFPKGLSPEDFIGCVVDMGTAGLSIITDVYEPSENAFAFGVRGYIVNYNRLTGKVTTNVLPPIDPGTAVVDPGDDPGSSM